jgi:hypothetical protein
VISIQAIVLRKTVVERNVAKGERVRETLVEAHGDWEFLQLPLLNHVDHNPWQPIVWPDIDGRKPGADYMLFSKLEIN